VAGAPQEDPLDALIEAQAQRIAVLEALVADLRERLAAAERAGSRNSGNSSMPPSSDDLPGRKMPRKQRRAAERAEKKRNRGKQSASPGAAMRWEVPDRTEDHYPQGNCSCGRNLADPADLGVAPVVSAGGCRDRPSRTSGGFAAYTHTPSGPTLMHNPLPDPVGDGEGEGRGDGDDDGSGAGAGPAGWPGPGDGDGDELGEGRRPPDGLGVGAPE
jgi:hypothetical protein